MSDPSRAKALKFFNKQGTDSIIVACPNADWAPVFEGAWAASDAAATLAVQIGGTQASLTVNPTGSNNTHIITALRKGDSGESITYEIVENGNNTALSVVCTETPGDYLTAVAILVNLATDGAGNGISTARQVIDAVNASRACSKWVIVTPSGDVSGVIDEDSGPTALAGATPDEDTDLHFADAFTFAGVVPPGPFQGNAGDDVRVAVSAGTDDISVFGYWVQAADGGRPMGPDGIVLGLTAT